MVANTSISAEQVRHALEIAEQWLALNRDGVNAINVYPVPDGDTGTNMLATWRAALRATSEDPDHVGAFFGELSRGALFGARGNSGVILSQMIRGMAEALESAQDLDASALVEALNNAARTAHAAMSHPVEGTMLTVMRDTGTAAQAIATSTSDFATILSAAVDAAHASVRRTPELLPLLREAGVVDAGGMGVAILMQGLAAGLTGDALPEEPLVGSAEHVDLGGVAHEGHGYCTEFLVEGTKIDQAGLERALTEAGGDSILVVGSAEVTRVHVHIEDPGLALSAGSRAGSLSGVKVENMQAQHDRWADERVEAATDDAPDPEDLPAVGLVAVVPGPGIALAFRDLGAGRVIDASEAGKASAGEILEAAHRAGREHVIVLPNDKDIVLAAEQAASSADGFITVIPTRSVAQGLAAAVCYMSTSQRESMLEEMQDAVASARSVEVATASRDATVDGIPVRAGDPMAFLDGHLVGTAAGLDDALLLGLTEGGAADAEILAVYLGRDADDDAGSRVAERLRDTFPNADVEVFDGRQPHYVYIAAIE